MVLRVKRRATTRRFQTNRSANDQIKAIGGFAGFHHFLAGAKACAHGTLSQNFPMLLAQSFKEWKIGQFLPGKGFLDLAALSKWHSFSFFPYLGIANVVPTLMR